jgi:4-hydroxybenzoate polyprenyltransferase
LNTDLSIGRFPEEYPGLLLQFNILLLKSNSFRAKASVYRIIILVLWRISRAGIEMSNMLRSAKKILDFFIYSNLLIAVCAAFMIWESYVILEKPMQVVYMAIGFAATLFVYNIDRLVVLESLGGLKSERHEWIVSFARVMVVISALAVIFLGISMFYVPLRVILFLAHLGFISVAYSVPFMKRNGRRITLRSIKGLKIFLIAYVWVASTVMLPAVGAGLSLLNTDVLLLSVERGLFIFAITLPFDIRDYQSDKKTGVDTIPGMIGVPATRRLATVCMLICGIINLLHYPLHSSILWAKEFSFGSTLLLVYLAKEEHHEYFFTGLLDGTMLIQALLVLLADQIHF